MNAFNTKFTHRVNAGGDNSFFNLIDTVNPSLERAIALADLMEVAFEPGMPSETPNLWRAAQAIRFEILDAKVLLDAYVDEVRAKPKQSDIVGGEQ